MATLIVLETAPNAKKLAASIPRYSEMGHVVLRAAGKGRGGKGSGRGGGGKGRRKGGEEEGKIVMWEWATFCVRLTYHGQGNAHGKPEWADD